MPNHEICEDHPLLEAEWELDLPISGADFQWVGLLITRKKED